MPDYDELEKLTVDTHQRSLIVHNQILEIHNNLLQTLFDEVDALKERLQKQESESWKRIAGGDKGTRELSDDEFAAEEATWD